MLKFFTLAIFITRISSAIIAQKRAEEVELIRPLECIDMVKGEGEFTFQQATGWDSECVIYFIAEINEILELQLLEANYNCEQESVDLVNGWIRNGQTIPRQTTNRSIAKEHMCSTSTTYVTSQNAAMLSVKLNTGSSFTISSVARTIDNVCDAIIPELMPRWKSYSINEKHRACSVHIFYPVQINVPIATVQNKLLVHTQTEPHNEPYNALEHDRPIVPGVTLKRTGHTVITILPRAKIVTFKLKLRSKRPRIGKSRRHTRRHTRSNH